jgi:predicted DNA-binding transcriptional regulator AlpA
VVKAIPPARIGLGRQGEEMKAPLPYPPPWQDVTTLCAHICVSEGTLDNWTRLHGFPPARMRGGKRVWRWSEVDAWMAGNSDIVDQDNLIEKVRHATREAVNGR